MSAGADIQQRITDSQRLIRETAERQGWPLYSIRPVLRQHYRWIARWWELEAKRGYVGVVDDDGLNSSDRSRVYAANYRWLVELMDNGHRVITENSDVHGRPGVYVDGELAIKYMARQRKVSASPRPPRKKHR